MTRRVTSGAGEAAAACASTAARLSTSSFFMSQLDHASRNAVSEPRAKFVKEMSAGGGRGAVQSHYFWDDTAVVPPVVCLDDPQTHGPRCAAEQLPLLRSARPRLRRRAPHLESRRAKNLRDPALQFPRRMDHGENFRRAGAVSDHLHFRRYFHGSVRLRRVAARDLARVFRLHDSLAHGFVHRLDSSGAGLAKPESL